MRVAGLLFFFLVFILSGCRMAGFQTITMQRTPCYGQCPVYRLELNSRGVLSFLPIRFTQRTDSFSTMLSVAERYRMVRDIKMLKIKPLNQQYPAPDVPVPQDLPSTILTFQAAGIPDTIIIRGGMGEDLPSELLDFVSDMDKLWQKVR